MQRAASAAAIFLNAVHLRFLWAPVHQVIQSQDPRSNTHWRTTFCLHDVRQGIPS